MAHFERTEFHAQKHGNAPSEYEDAFAFNPASGRSRTLRVAISDGATESSFAGEWAKMLVRSVRNDWPSDADDLKARTEELGDHWKYVVSRRPLPWFAEEKVRQGAFATLLGLEITDPVNEQASQGTWRAAAIGDSCVFQIRNNALCAAFPFARTVEFTNTPALVSSNPIYNATIAENWRLHRGDWQDGDNFILATDALAAWFIRTIEANDQPWRELSAIKSHSQPTEAFAKWLQRKRAVDMKNDDVTCVMILALKA